MYFNGSKICVLDIETTGITPDLSHFVLGSLLSFEGGDEARLKQYFAEDISEERTLLSEYIEEASKYDVLLTYNGKSFDIPFLLSRANKLELDIFEMPYNLDLYLVLDRYSPLRKFMPNLKQKTVEDFMGLWPYREDKISGREIPSLYPHGKELMLLHNRDDVLQLGKLLRVLEKADLHKALYAFGFPVISKNKKLYVRNVKFENGFLKVTGTQTTYPDDFISYGYGNSDSHIKFTKQSSAFEISVPVFKMAGAIIIDLVNLSQDITAELSAFPNYESGYLVLKNNTDINYLEVNSFIKAFLLKILDDMPGVHT